jgi:hypothetical protein
MEESEDNEKEVSFLQKLFVCCFREKGGEFEINSEATSREMIFENDSCIFPTNMIRPEEKIIQFTKDGLVDFITKMQNLVFPVIYEDSSTKLSKRNYTELNEKIPLIRVEIIKHKIYFTEVPSIQQMAQAITNPEMRKKWDKNIKEYKIIGKIKKESEIVKTVTNKQLSVIAEKEFYDKRVSFSDGGNLYLFSSSVPEINYVNATNLDRGINYICALVIKEDEDNFYFDCFNQIDMNINIPIEFIETNLLRKVKNFFDKYFEFLNVLK